MNIKLGYNSDRNILYRCKLYKVYNNVYNNSHKGVTMVPQWGRFGIQTWFLEPLQ